MTWLGENGFKGLTSDEQEAVKKFFTAINRPSREDPLRSPFR